MDLSTPSARETGAEAPMATLKPWQQVETSPDRVSIALCSCRDTDESARIAWPLDGVKASATDVM